jgi:hypothetical protein
MGVYPTRIDPLATYLRILRATMPPAMSSTPAAIARSEAEGPPVSGSAVAVGVAVAVTVATGVAVGVAVPPLYWFAAGDTVPGVPSAPKHTPGWLCAKNPDRLHASRAVIWPVDQSLSTSRASCVCCQTCRALCSASEASGLAKTSEAAAITASDAIVNLPRKSSSLHPVGTGSVSFQHSTVAPYACVVARKSFMVSFVIQRPSTDAPFE